MTNKEKLLNYIKSFSVISVTRICNDLGIKKSNVFAGTTSEKKLQMVVDEINKRMEKIKNEH